MIPREFVETLFKKAKALPIPPIVCPWCGEARIWFHLWFRATTDDLENPICDFQFECRNCDTYHGKGWSRFFNAEDFYLKRHEDGFVFYEPRQYNEEEIVEPDRRRAHWGIDLGLSVPEKTKEFLRNISPPKKCPWCGEVPLVRIEIPPYPEGGQKNGCLGRNYECDHCAQIFTDRDFIVYRDESDEAGYFPVKNEERKF